MPPSARSSRFSWIKKLLGARPPAPRTAEETTGGSDEACLLRIVKLPDGSAPEAPNLYVRTLDPHAMKGERVLEVTENRSLAMRFPNPRAAADFWKQPEMREFSVMIEPAP